MTDRRFVLATAAAVSLIGYGASSVAAPAPRPAATAASTPDAASITSVDRAKTLPCQRFRQTPDGSWTMLGPVQANGTNLENVTFAKGTAEAAVLSQRCLP